MDRLSVMQPMQRGVRRRFVDAGGVPSEWFEPVGAPPDSVIMYMHGGAFITGSTKTHRAFTARLSFLCNSRLLSLNYRLAPEYPYPAGLEDCLAAYRWLLRSGIRPDRIVVAGDSAGGNFALGILIALRDKGEPLPAGAVGISPVTDLAMTGGSYESRADVDLLFGRSSALINAMAVDKGYIGNHDPKDPLISPLYANLQGLPPILLHVGDHEILLDDSTRFAERAREAGVDIRLTVWPEMFHVFQIGEAFIPEAREAVAEITGFIKGRLELL
jgi:monoterpene epsilon-lactone hydrolase